MVEERSEELFVRISLHGNPMPERNGDWWDLSTAEEVSMKPMEFKLISLGISMELPKGYEAHLLPRSSTFKKWGIIMANGMGLIDEAYCGENDIWRFPAVALRETIIPSGIRICQFRLFSKSDSVRFESVPFLENKNRGGFGSTGL